MATSRAPHTLTVKVIGGEPGNACTLHTAKAAFVVHRVGAWLFASTDTEAGWRGWQVVERLSGLSRRYRDPRFDTWT